MIHILVLHQYYGHIMKIRVLSIHLFTKDISNTPIHCPLDAQEMDLVTKKYKKVIPVIKSLLKEIKKSTNDFDDFDIRFEPIKEPGSNTSVIYSASAYINYTNNSQTDLGENRVLFAINDAFLESIRILNEIDNALQNKHTSIILNTVVTNKEDSIYCINKRNMDLAYNIYYKWLEPKIHDVVINDRLITLPKIEFLNIKTDGPQEFYAIGKIKKNDRDKGTCKFIGTIEEGKSLKGTCVFDIDDDDRNIIDDMWLAEKNNTTVRFLLVANQNFVCRESIPCGQYLVRDYEINPELNHETEENLFP